MAKINVITGGPGVGKTTLIERLSKVGYLIIPEQARILIKEGKYLPWEDYPEFATELIKRQKEEEARVKRDFVFNHAFCDRGLGDNVAYKTIYRYEPEKELIEEAKNRYNKIFFLDRLPIYKLDAQRKEDLEKALEIHREIEKAYLELGYNIIKVPDIGIERRTELILKEISNS